MSACHAEGRGFESRHPRHLFVFLELTVLFQLTCRWVFRHGVRPLLVYGLRGIAGGGAGCGGEGLRVFEVFASLVVEDALCALCVLDLSQRTQAANRLRPTYFFINNFGTQIIIRAI